MLEGCTAPRQGGEKVPEGVFPTAVLGHVLVIVRVECLHLFFVQFDAVAGESGRGQVLGGGAVESSGWRPGESPLDFKERNYKMRLSPVRDVFLHQTRAPRSYSTDETSGSDALYECVHP